MSTVDFFDYRPTYQVMHQTDHTRCLKGSFGLMEWLKMK